jgi:transposase
MKTNCPNCQAEEHQVKNGLNPSGSQRYQCKICGRVYTPEENPRGYDQSKREQALKLYVDGVNLRRIGRILGINHQTVANWVNAHSEQLPPAPIPEEVDIIEMDEMFTFVGEKKASLHRDICGQSHTLCGQLVGDNRT